MPSVATWWCGQEPEREYVIEHLEKFVVKPAFGSLMREPYFGAKMTPEERAALPPVRWRMVWRNPANGREALYIASHAGAVEGLREDEGKALLAELMEEATREPTYLHRWRPGDVVMWDNRASMHRGRPFPGTQSRLMVRTTISARDEDGLDSLRPAASP